MCQCLKIARSSYYAYQEQHEIPDPLSELAVMIFNTNQRVYGTRKIKVELMKQGHRVSRRRIARIMRCNGLVSVYTVKKYKVSHTSVNEAVVSNEVNREFNERSYKEVVVSDLPYVRVLDKWHYICILLDLHNREIIGYSCGTNKTAKLVKDAFATVKSNLNEIEYFHTDRGSEFDNYMIDEILKEFNIKRSLSKKGCPYDNAVAEAQFKFVKTEFVYPRLFQSLEQLKQELSAYVYWFNNKRIHSTLGYKSPVEYREALLMNFV